MTGKLNSSLSNMAGLKTSTQQCQKDLTQIVSTAHYENWSNENPDLTEEFMNSIGPLSSEEEIAAACYHLDSNNILSWFMHGHKIFECVVQFGPGAMDMDSDSEDEDFDIEGEGETDEEDGMKRVDLEMGLYRKTMHPAYFVGGQELSLLILGELDRAVDYWIYITLQNISNHLIKGRVKDVKDKGGSCAEVFLAFMDAYKEKKHFKVWTLGRLIGIRYLVFLEDRQSELKRAQTSQADSPVPKRRNLNNDTAGNLTGNDGEKHNEASSASSSSTSSSSATSQSSNAKKLLDASIGQSASISQSFKNIIWLDASIKSRLAIPKEIVTHAKNITSEYLASQARHMSTKVAWDAAAALTLHAIVGFPQNAEKKIDSVIKFVQASKKASVDKNDWPLSRAKNFLRDFAKVSAGLEAVFKAYMKPLEAAAKASDELSVALLDRQKWEKKMVVLNKALRAIQALKEL